MDVSKMKAVHKDGDTINDGNEESANEESGDVEEENEQVNPRRQIR